VRQLDRIILVDRQDQTLLPTSIEPIWSDTAHVVVPSSAIPEGKWIATTHMIYAPQGAVVEIIPNVLPATSIADSASADATETAAQ
jgi:hypothetical protein